MNKEFIFNIDNKHNWVGQKRAVGGALQILLDNTKTSLVVTVGEQKNGKSYKQLKGYFRLVNMIIPAITKANHDCHFDKDIVDDIIKDTYGYYTKFKETKSYKSKAKATIQDMMGLIKTAEKIGQFYGVEDCYLSSEDERDLMEYYNDA